MKKNILTFSFLLITAISISQTAQEYFELANARFNIESYYAAIEYFSKAIEIEPENAKFNLGRGFSKFNLKDYKGALIDFKKVIELNPNHGTAYYKRGESYYYLNSFKNALDDFDKAIENGQNKCKFLCIQR